MEGDIKNTLKTMFFYHRLKGAFPLLKKVS